MSRFHAYIKTANTLVNTYDGKSPLGFHLKTFFASHKKMGSTDRKTIAHICYCYYRCYFLLNQFSIEEQMINAVYLCNSSFGIFLQHIAVSLNETVNLPLDKKLEILKLDKEKIFPYQLMLGSEINNNEFFNSLLTQPDLFIRLRPGQQESVLDKLTSNSIQFSQEGTCVRMPNNTQLNGLIKLNAEAVIQDYNSQKVLDFLDEWSFETTKVSAWDCCAASGGKAILLVDKWKNIQLTVSDIRKNILVSLQQRLQQASVQVAEMFVADLTRPVESEKQFDLILADMPCTGSGTWARTPEQMVFFKKKMLNEYATKQQQIAANVLHALVPGGLFFYITCSVFAAENEEQVEALAKKYPVEILLTKYLHGYNKKADTLFVAVFKKTG